MAAPVIAASTGQFLTPTVSGGGGAVPDAGVKVRDSEMDDRSQIDDRLFFVLFFFSFAGRDAGARFDAAGRVGVGVGQRLRPAGALPLHALAAPLLAVHGHRRADADQHGRRAARRGQDRRQGGSSVSV